MKKLVFNDSRQMEIQSADASNGVLHVRIILTSAESLKALFGDSFATQKMTYFENQIQKEVYENYTTFKYVKEETGGVFEVELVQPEADLVTRVATMEKENKEMQLNMDMAVAELSMAIAAAVAPVQPEGGTDNV